MQTYIVVYQGTRVVVHHEEKPLLPPICPNLTVGPHCFCLNSDIHNDDEDDGEGLGHQYLTEYHHDATGVNVNVKILGSKIHNAQ